MRTRTLRVVRAPRWYSVANNAAHQENIKGIILFLVPESVLHFIRYLLNLYSECDVSFTYAQYF